MTLGTTPIKTIEDAKKQQMVVAGTGAGSETDTWPIVLNEVLGTKFKLVTGYLGHPGNHHRHRARRGAGPLRVQPVGDQDLQARMDGDHKINVLVQIGLEKAAEFPDAPLIFDLVSKPEDRQLIEMMVGPGAMARPFVAPPGLPANKAALLRRGFDATMKDPEFLAEAAKIKADINPRPARRCRSWSAASTARRSRWSSGSRSSSRSKLARAMAQCCITGRLKPGHRRPTELSAAAPIGGWRRACSLYCNSRYCGTA